MYAGIDLGSTNIKVAIYDEQFHLIDRQSRPVSYLRENGFVEFDANLYFEGLTALIASMVEKNGIAPHNLQWAAAHHNERGHPHCHIVFWDKFQPFSRKNDIG